MNRHIVIIPAYQPDMKLITFLQDIKKRTDCMIIVVNDGSNSAVNEIFSLAEDYATVLVHDVNKGKGAAIKTALEYVKTHMNNNCIVAIADADGQHLTDDLMRVIHSSEVGNGSFVIGCRKFTGNVPLRSKLGNSITKTVFGLSTGVWLNDTQTGLRAFGSSLIPFMLSVNGERYEYEMNVLLESSRNDIKINQEFIETVYLNENKSSHFNAIKDSFRIYKDILKFSFSSIASFLVDYALFALFCSIFLKPVNIFSFVLSATAFCNILARVFSGTFNYIMNKKYVFKAKGSYLRTALQYFALALIILVLNTLLLAMLTNYLFIPKLLAKIIVEIIMFTFSWSVQKFIIFKKKGRLSV